MHMMISEVVNEVGTKSVKTGREMYVICDISWTVYRGEEGTSSNTVDMDNCKIFTSVVTGANKFGLDYPLSSFVMNWLSNRYEPMYEGAVIVYLLMHKWEEEIHPSNTHAHKSTVVWIGSCDKHSVIAWIFAMPYRIGSNKLVVHACSSTEVTWSIVSGSCRVIYENAAIELRAIVKRDFCRINVVSDSVLIKEEVPDKRR